MKAFVMTSIAIIGFALMSFPQVAVADRDMGTNDTLSYGSQDMVTPDTDTGYGDSEVQAYGSSDDVTMVPDTGYGNMETAPDTGYGTIDRNDQSFSGPSDNDRNVIPRTYGENDTTNNGTTTGYGSMEEPEGYGSSESGLSAGTWRGNGGFGGYGEGDQSVGDVTY